MTNDCLVKVKSIAECSPFDLHYAIIGIENQFYGLLRVAVLHRFYCTFNKGYAYYFQLILFLFSENNSETEITLKNITQYFSEAAESYIKVF